jgi:hypothetical protein
MPTNPDTGAAELMSPGSIGAAQQTINTVPSDYTGTTAVDWYIYLRNKGLGKPVHVLEIPGYTPDPIVMVGQYMSIESALQQTVKWLVGPVLTRTWTDARVNSFLSGVAVDYAIWNGNADPGAADLQGLVDKYTKVYRIAVTPV